MKTFFLLVMSVLFFSCSTTTKNEEKELSDFKHTGTYIQKLIEENNKLTNKQRELNFKVNQCNKAMDINYKDLFEASVPIRDYSEPVLISLLNENLDTKQLTRIKFFISNEENVKKILEKNNFKLAEQLIVCNEKYMSLKDDNSIFKKQKKHFIKLAKVSGRNVASLENQGEEEMTEPLPTNDEENLDTANQIMEKEFEPLYPVDENNEVIIDENQNFN